MFLRGATAYRSVLLTLTPPPRLLLEVFRTLGEALRQAQAFIVVGDLAGKAAAVDRALGLLGELETALDQEVDAELCGSLSRLYRACAERVLLGSLELRLEPLQEAELLLRPVRQAFEAIVDASDRPGLPPAPHKPEAGHSVS